MADEPELRLPPTPAEWEATKAENERLRSFVDYIRQGHPIHKVTHKCWICLALDALDKKPEVAL